MYQVRRRGEMITGFLDGRRAGERLLGRLKHK
jgi:hypothetical protein